MVDGWLMNDVFNGCLIRGVEHCLHKEFFSLCVVDEMPPKNRELFQILENRRGIANQWSFTAI